MPTGSAEDELIRCTASDEWSLHRTDDGTVHVGDAIFLSGAQKLLSCEQLLKFGSPKDRAGSAGVASFCKEVI